MLSKIHHHTHRKDFKAELDAAKIVGIVAAFLIAGLAINFMSATTSTMTGAVNTTVSEASYIIFNDVSGMTCAKNSTSGRIDAKESSLSDTLDAIDLSGTIYIKNGDYSITSKVNISPSTNLIGESISGVIITAATNLNEEMIQGINVVNAKISTLTLDGNKDNNDPAYNLGTGIKFNSTAVRFDSFSKIENVHLTNFDDYGIILTNNIDGCTITNVEADNCDEHGICLDWAWDTIVTNCYLHGNLRSGIAMVGCQDCIISNNQAWDNGQQGINNAAGLRNSFLENDVRHNAGNGIEMDPSTAYGQQTLISGNQVYSNDKDGIYIENVDDIMIVGNNIHSNVMNGINMTGSERDMISNNHVMENGRNGINTSHASHRANIQGNYIYHNSMDGINVSVGNDYLISGNTINSNLRHGLRMNVSSAALIEGNKFYNNDYGASHNYCNIKLDPTGYNSLILDNHFSMTSGQGRHTLWNGMTSTVVKNNYFESGGSLGLIGASDWGSITVRYNSGFKTENQGTAVIASGTTSISFAHGMAMTPKGVTLGATNIEVTNAVVGWNATNITITANATTTGNREISWYAYY